MKYNYSDIRLFTEILVQGNMFVSHCSLCFASHFFLIRYKQTGFDISLKVGCTMYWVSYKERYSADIHPPLISGYSAELLSLIQRMLNPNPSTRITAEQILTHPSVLPRIAQLRIDVPSPNHVYRPSLTCLSLLTRPSLTYSHSLSHPIPAFSPPPEVTTHTHTLHSIST